jgi:UDP-GlcNAc3NAcA epimerase
MKILTVLGARPQFIKAAALSSAIRAHNQNAQNAQNTIEDVLVHTGQHFDHNMSQIFFDELEITPPKYQLNVSSATHGSMTGQMMIRLDEILISEKPDSVLVYGDTNSTLAGALCASKLRIPLIHVEAGLRSFNRDIPEEINRLLTDRVADLLFCPSEKAVKWLAAEGITENVHVSGDIMFDSTLMFSDRDPSADLKKLISGLRKNFVTVTIHRAANTENVENLREIVRALNEISKRFDVVFLVHPRTKKCIETNKIDVSQLKVCEPLGYTDLLHLVKLSQCVLTDSGGLQKEAFFLQKPCVTLRDETEWVELLEEGVNELTGASFEKILSSFEKLHAKPIHRKNIYGDGKASQKILNSILTYFENRGSRQVSRRAQE